MSLPLSRRFAMAVELLWARRPRLSGLEELFTAHDDDDAAYAADTAALRAYDARRRASQPDGCVPSDSRGIQGCRTCAAPKPSAEEIEIRRLCWWLIETLPELWYAADPADTREMAEALVRLRAGVDEGTWSQ